ncbi:MAG: hypothetical protein AUK16_03360 [Parcubacteria group bacterium CG2_30_44_11]|nr:MAG: hypothetical protein AUK16_03360 [Parcubacteria group bacterium CG2_30_44_11]
MQDFDRSITGERIIELRQQEEDNLIKSLAVQYGYSYVDLRGVTINPTALLMIDEVTAKKAQAVGFESHRNHLSIAIRNPNNPETKTLLAALKAKGIESTIFMTSTGSLEHAWTRYRDQKTNVAVERGILDINTAQIAEQMKLFKTPETVKTYLNNIRSVNNARRVSETLETMFAGALALGASDIHIEPEETGIRLRYRLDGVLYDITDLDRAMYARITSRLKLLSGMILNVKSQAQDGRFTFTIAMKDIEVRSSIIPGASGESMVMRLLDPTVASFSMDLLGINPILKSVMEAELARPNGLILTTGPTGSGKTTALYAFLREAHKPGVKIITIENPVEYKLDNIVQTQVSENYSFANGLRAVLRQDPDIIMVGEIRDREVAETAIHAAQTGHLVFSTLHTNSAVGAFPRLIDLGVDYRMIGVSVNLVLGQRLVRILCPNCKAARTATEAEHKIITQVLATHPKPPILEEPLVIYDAVGCAACNHTGYKGRQAVFEAIKVDTAVEEAIIRDPREHIILEAAKAQAIPSMAEDGIEKVVQGITSLEELMRVVDLYDGRHIKTTPKDIQVDSDFSTPIV